MRNPTQLFIGLITTIISILFVFSTYVANADEQELLPAQEAFAFKAERKSEGVYARWEIADGYYMYRSKFHFSVVDESGNVISTSYDIPKGKIKNDPSFGDVEVYTKYVDIFIPLDSNTENINLTAKGQGCNEPIGVCYPPISLNVPLIYDASVITAQSVSTEENRPSASTLNQTSRPPSKVWWIMLTAFVAGIGLTFTPCVLPLIPILSSVIAGQGKTLTKTRAATLSIIYVLGTAVTYAAIGAVAGATGEQLQAYFQNIWTIGAMALVFFMMALSMFGLFSIQMPSFVQSRLSSGSSAIKGGSAPMVFVLGLMSALVVGACVSPILISFLSLAIAEGSASLGAMTMFSMAIGMGIPLVILGIGAGHIMPKAGMWMDNVKYVFGVMLLGVGIYMLSVLPNVPVLYLWAALFIIVAIYLGATQPLLNGGTGWQKFGKGLGTLMLIWGGFSLVGALYGERDILHPLPMQLLRSSEASVPSSSGDEESIFIQVNSIVQLESEFDRAKQLGKNVIIDYYANWCVDCVKMEKTTFSEIAVQKELDQRYVALQIDVTDPNNAAVKALKNRYGIFGPPAVIFFDKKGKLMEDKNFYGYKKPQEFLATLRG